MTGKTRTALRSTLQKEDEALDTRLPELAAAEPVVAVEPVAAEAQGELVAVAIEAVSELVAPVEAPAKPKAVRRPAAKAAVTKAPAAPAAKAKVVVAEKAEKPVKPVKAEKPAKVEKPVEKLAEKPLKAPRDKVVRDSFSMPKSEHAQLKVLRETLARAGRICTKSELLRVGMQLLMKEPAASVKILVEGLTAVPKGKSAK